MYNDSGIAKAQIATRLHISRIFVNDVLKEASRRSSTTRTRLPILSNFEINLIIKTIIESFKDRIFT